MPRRSDAAGAAPAPVGAQPAAVAPQQAAAAGAAPPPQALPSPPGLTYDTVVVQPEGTDGITLPKFLLPDGRSPRRPLVTYVPQRFLEIVLFQRYDGGSSGAVHKIIGLSGLGATAWTINAAAVLEGEISQAHSQFIFDKYKELLPTSGDPLLANRARNIVLIPVATAASVCRGRGRSPATTAFLRACAPNEVPRSWEIQEQAEAQGAQGEEDLLLTDELDEAEDADADVAPSFEAELRAGGGFSSFTQKLDDEKSHDYAIKGHQLGALLKKEGDTYIAFKVSPLEARRASTAVADKTAQADLQNYCAPTSTLEHARHRPTTARPPPASQPPVCPHRPLPRLPQAQRQAAARRALLARPAHARLGAAVGERMGRLHEGGARPRLLVDGQLHQLAVRPRLVRVGLARL